MAEKTQPVTSAEVRCPYLQPRTRLCVLIAQPTGLFAGTHGTRRVLKLFDKYNIKATWFIPGHSLETFPEECAMVRDAGHEIGLHGYSHENPSDMSFEQQQDVLDKTFRLLTEFCGKPPRGSVAPWWEVSEAGTELLLSYGIEYDHSMGHEDCQMYWLRTGDTWTKIDYSKKAVEWMKPLVKGKMTGLVEIPGSWYIDDLPPMMFVCLSGIPLDHSSRAIPVLTLAYLELADLFGPMQMKNSANSHGWVNPRDIEDIWKVCPAPYGGSAYTNHCVTLAIRVYSLAGRTTSITTTVNSTSLCSL